MTRQLTISKSISIPARLLSGKQICLFPTLCRSRLRAAIIPGTINVRRYLYDATGHLATVSDTSRVMYRFAYERLLSDHDSSIDPFLMTSITDGRGTELLHNSYLNGRVCMEKLATGDIYRYTYSFENNRKITQTTVALPNGAIRTFSF